MIDRSLKVFIDLCETNNMTFTSKNLFISQPAVSQYVRYLEEKLNSKLFLRTNKGIVPTEEAIKLYSYAKKLKKIEDEIFGYFDKINENKKFRIGLTIVPSFIIFKLLHKTFKDKDIDLSIEIDNKYSIKEKLLKNKLDLGIIDGKIKNKHIKYESFYKDYLCVVGKLEKDNEINELNLISKLNKKPFILFKNSSDSKNLIEKYLLKNNFELSNISTSISVKFIINEIKEGNCVSILPQSIIKQEFNDFKYYKSTIEDYNNIDWGIIYKELNKDKENIKNKLIKTLKDFLEN